MRREQRKLREVKKEPAVPADDSLSDLVQRTTPVEPIQVERISAESLALLQQTKAQVEAAQIAFQSAWNFILTFYKFAEGDSLDLATGVITRGTKAKE
jgi:hypothetical protein